MEKIFTIESEIDVFQNDLGGILDVVSERSVAKNIEYFINRYNSISNDNSINHLKYKFLLSFLIDSLS